MFVGVSDQQVGVSGGLYGLGSLEQFESAGRIRIEQQFAGKLKTVPIPRIRVHYSLEQLFSFRGTAHLGIGLRQSCHTTNGVGLNLKTAIVGIDRRLIVLSQPVTIAQKEPELWILRS